MTLVNDVDMKLTDQMLLFFLRQPSANVRVGLYACDERGLKAAKVHRANREGCLKMQTPRIISCSAVGDLRS
jgi:hypothetical protein